MNPTGPQAKLLSSSFYFYEDVSVKCQNTILFKIRIYLSLYNQQEKTQCSETVILTLNSSSVERAREMVVWSGIWKERFPGYKQEPDEEQGRALVGFSPARLWH